LRIVGRLRVVDLAGAQRTGGAEVSQREIERSKKINQSLSALGNVIAGLAEGKRVPFRNSKLTRLLEDSLGGGCITSIIATLSPAMSAFEDSLSTLKFAERAKAINRTRRGRADAPAAGTHSRAREAPKALAPFEFSLAPSAGRKDAVFPTMALYLFAKQLPTTIGPSTVKFAAAIPTSSNFDPAVDAMSAAVGSLRELRLDFGNCFLTTAAPRLVKFISNSAHLTTLCLTNSLRDLKGGVNVELGAASAAALAEAIFKKSSLVSFNGAEVEELKSAKEVKIKDEAPTPFDVAMVAPLLMWSQRAKVLIPASFSAVFEKAQYASALRKNNQAIVSARYLARICRERGHEVTFRVNDGTFPPQVAPISLRSAAALMPAELLRGDENNPPPPQISAAEPTAQLLRELGHPLAGDVLKVLDVSAFEWPSAVGDLFFLERLGVLNLRRFSFFKSIGGVSSARVLAALRGHLELEELFLDFAEDDVPQILGLVDRGVLRNVCGLKINEIRSIADVNRLAESCPPPPFLDAMPKLILSLLPNAALLQIQTYSGADPVAMNLKTLMLSELESSSTSPYRVNGVVKLMIVGLGEVGKTSLLAALQSPNSRAGGIHANARTVGVDLTTWVPRNDLTVRVWDFAGQSLYYVTHQFFLSPTAFYALVWKPPLSLARTHLIMAAEAIALRARLAPLFRRLRAKVTIGAATSDETYALRAAERELEIFEKENPRAIEVLREAHWNSFDAPYCFRCKEAIVDVCAASGKPHGREAKSKCGECGAEGGEVVVCVEGGRGFVHERCLVLDVQLGEWVKKLQMRAPGAAAALVMTHSAAAHSPRLLERASAYCAGLISRYGEEVAALRKSLEEQLNAMPPDHAERRAVEARVAQLREWRPLSLVDGGRCFEVDSMSGDGIETLRRAVVEHLARLPTFKMVYPAAWDGLAQRLAAQRAKGVPYLAMGEVKRLCRLAGVAEGELGGALAFLHDLGDILYFESINPTSFLKDIIFLDRGWVINALKSLVNHDVTRFSQLALGIDRPDLKGLDEPSRAAALRAYRDAVKAQRDEIRQLANELVSTAVLRPKLMPYVWAGETAASRAVVVELLQAFDVALDDGDGNLIVPCLFRRGDSTAVAHSAVTIADPAALARVTFSFASLPDGFFYRVIARVRPKFTRVMISSSFATLHRNGRRCNVLLQDPLDGAAATVVFVSAEDTSMVGDVRLSIAEVAAMFPGLVQLSCNVPCPSCLRASIVTPPSFPFGLIGSDVFCPQECVTVRLEFPIRTDVDVIVVAADGSPYARGVCAAIQTAMDGVSVEVATPSTARMAESRGHECFHACKGAAVLVVLLEGGVDDNPRLGAMVACGSAHFKHFVPLVMPGYKGGGKTWHPDSMPQLGTVLYTKVVGGGYRCGGRAAGRAPAAKAPDQRPGESGGGGGLLKLTL
jgi:hypothetical protein